MKKKEGSVGQRIIQGLREFADVLDEKKPIAAVFNCRAMKLELEATTYSPELVKKTRKLLGASQNIFATFLGVSVNTVRSWEQGTNNPRDVACRFMDEIRHNPNYWQNRLKESAVLK